MADRLIKAISKSSTIRAYAAITTNTVSSAYKIQKPTALSGIILGNTLTAALLCAATLKGNRDRISLAYQGDGVIGKAMAEATANGKVRGYTANPQSEFCAGVDVKTQINEAIGKASLLTVTKDLGLKQPYSGTINCMTGDIGADMAYYFTQSEQIPSAAAISTIPNSDNSGVQISGGYLVQQIPQNGGINKNEKYELEKITAATMSISLNSILLQEETPEDLLKNIFSNVEYEVLNSVNLSFKCTCSKEMLINAINMFDDGTKKEIKQSYEKIQIKCEFCKKIYYILSRDVR